MTKKSKDQSLSTRRAFLGSGLLSGVGLTIAMSSTVHGETTADTECASFSAADLLYFYSMLAWKIPAKLAKAEEAKDKEQVVYSNFETHYKKLSQLARQLKLRCSNLSDADPRRRSATELVELTERNVRAPRPEFGGPDAEYFRLATLVVENRHLSRVADAAMPAGDTAGDDSKLICEMLAEIRAMDQLKGSLDIARSEANAAFAEFAKAIRGLHETLVEASDSAAEFDLGTGTREAAVSKVGEAEKLLDALEKESSDKSPTSLSPAAMKVLVAVPKAMLTGQIPNKRVSSTSTSGEVRFTTISYGTAAQMSRHTAIVGILRDCITPSNWWVVNGVALACGAVLDLYGNNPPRESAVKNTLISIPGLSGRSKFSDAARRIASLS